MEKTIIVGAGQAALEVAFGLRHKGYDGDISIYGNEPYAPYQRPPLSKGYLLGEISEERLYFRDEHVYQDHNIKLVTDVNVTSIEPSINAIHYENKFDKFQDRYQHLVLATGSRPRELPLEGAGSENVFTLRSINDIHAIRAHMKEGAKLAIIGGGYIGLELAAVAVKLGLSVSVIEMMPRLLARVARPQTASYLHDVHAAAGVNILTDTGVQGLTTNGNNVCAIGLSDGTELPCDFVVVGIGALPNVEFAEGSGISIERGFHVNARCETNLPNIYAAGDVSCFKHPRYGHIRLESVGNAIDQAVRISAAITGEEVAAPSIPWFWSDQYDHKMQAAGLVMHNDVEVLLRQGDREGAQSLWIYDDKGLLSVEAMNDPKAYLMGKRWLEQGQNPDKNAIIDPAQNLKKCPTSPMIL